MGDVSEKSIEKRWQIEANNPRGYSEWRPLWDFGEDKLLAFQSLRDELNVINAPVQLRIVLNSD